MNKRQRKKKDKRLNRWTDDQIWKMKQQNRPPIVWNVIMSKPVCEWSLAGMKKFIEGNNLIPLPRPEFIIPPEIEMDSAVAILRRQRE
jgi:hypothetical protein